MKFANYKFYARGVNNLGDNMQIIAIDYIYERMGVPKEEIIYIDKNETNSYNGEYVILPVMMPLVDYTEGGIAGRFSDYIIPVFLGLTLAKDSLLQQEIEYYNRFEPIGCRDERTMNTLRGYGIQAYLHGCITTALPKRNIENKKFNKVFIVDVAKEVIPYIPSELLKDAEYLSHMHENVGDPKKLMQEYYDRYKNEAKLVITSLLHCSVPCMAAGIPVVLVKQDISYRFGWLEKLLPLYDRGDYSNINWNPSPVDYEEHKEKLITLTINKLYRTYNKYKDIFDLSWFYENRTKKKYIIDAFETIRKYIDNRFADKNAKYKYSIWGLSQISNLTYNYITNNYPHAKLMHVYDSFRKLNFEGIMSELPENIKNYPDEIIIVTTNGARKMAENLFNQINKDKNDFVIWEPIK